MAPKSISIPDCVRNTSCVFEFRTRFSGFIHNKARCISTSLGFNASLKPIFHNLTSGPIKMFILKLEDNVVS